MAPMPVQASSHVPAWKKLGLKLRFAKEDPADNSEVQALSENRKKRKVQADVFSPDVGATPPDRPAKKPKKQSRIEHKGTDTGDGNSNSADHSLPQSVSNEPSSRPVLVKQKSVSFTPETKTQDGEGVKQLYAKWLDNQRANDPLFNPSTAHPALKSITPSMSESPTSTSTRKTGKPKKPKKKDKPKEGQRKKDKSKKVQEDTTSSQTASPPHDHPALTYLQAHHTSPDSWKFSKAYQNYLLKHLFSLTYLPSSHDQALLTYLRGLQGSARSRIRAEAFSIREEDQKWLTSAPAEDKKMENETSAQCLARRKRDYENAVAHIKQQLRKKEDEREDMEWDLLGGKEEWDKRLYKRRRAEVVLWGVGEQEDIKEDTTAPSQRDVKEDTTVPPQRAVLGDRNLVSSSPVTIQSRGMGGVEQISKGGVASTSQGKKIRFDGDDVNPVAINGREDMKSSKAIPNGENKTTLNGVQGRKLRRRKKKRTGVPDDDDSSSSDSSSSSESESESEVEKEKGRLAQTRQQVSNNFASDEDSSEGSTESSSSSETLDGDSESE